MTSSKKPHNEAEQLDEDAYEPTTIDDIEMYAPNDNRGRWASKVEFILSCLGYSIGLGSVWRFPYLCYRSGGGAFLVPFLLMCFLCGIPLFFMEVIMGQFSSLGCIGIFRMAPLFKGAGFAIVIVNIICAVYYSVIIAYPLVFMKYIFTAKLPWDSCSNSWNTNLCVDVNELVNHNFTSRVQFKTPADEFFHLELLKISGSIEEIGTIQWQLFVAVLLAWLMIYLCIIKSVESIGKVVYFTSTYPIIILVILFIRGVTLPGAGNGILFYIYPEWSRLLDLKVWADAAIQIFFSMGPGWGGIVNMSSFNKFSNTAKLDSVIIPIINCSNSIFAGFVVFSVLGYLSHQTGIPVAHVATSGPGLAFITYPQAISLLPFPQLWSALFFSMLLILGLGSVFVQIEAVINSIVDEVPKLRSYKFFVTLMSCTILFTMSILLTTNGGMYIFQLLDWYSVSIPVLVICIFEIIMVAWIYGIDNFFDDINFMIGQKLEKIWYYCWKYITPLILVSIFFTTVVFLRPVRYNDQSYPEWAVIVGWCICGISIACIPLYMIKAIFFDKGSIKENFQNSLKPKFWYPAQDKYNLAYKAYKQSQKNK